MAFHLKQNFLRRLVILKNLFIYLINLLTKYANHRMMTWTPLSPRSMVGHISDRDCESIPKSGKIYDFGNEESMTYSVFFAVFGDLL
jgi:hypothetical protein